MLTHQQIRRAIKALDAAQDPTEPTGEPTGEAGEAIAEVIRKQAIGKPKEKTNDPSWRVTNPQKH